MSFNFVTLCQFYSITSPVIHETSLIKYGMREKVFFAYVTASVYQRR